MKIFLASDHGGYKLKLELIEFIKSLGHETEDLGCDNEESCDYPDFAQKLAKKVLESGNPGILCCGTGIGMSMAANRFKGIRATLCYDEFTTKMAKEHNNSNVLCLGARTSSAEDAKNITKIWIETPFSNEERHAKRVEKIDEGC